LPVQSLCVPRTHLSPFPLMVREYREVHINGTVGLEAARIGGQHMCQ
jgi:hypothetical protein